MDDKPRTLAFPAPARMSVSTGRGLWSLTEWTAVGVHDVFSYGGWFARGRHDFDSLATAKLAGRGDE